MTLSSLPLTIDSLHTAYAAGLSAVDLAREIDRRIIAADDPAIFISRPTSADLSGAAEALPPFDPVRFPLWGIPVAVKDNIDVAGLPTTVACPAFSYRPDRDATAVARLLGAGAIVVGKTNLDQFATGLVGTRSPYGVPRNPFDAGRVPGGSSSGSAVAVARGLASFALGTDTAGSGRVPAGFNNIVGLKPSVGDIPTAGVVPACRSLDCVSVFALTVSDAMRVHGIAAGKDPADPFSRAVDRTATPTAPVARVGLPRVADRLFFGDAAQEAAFTAAASVVAGLATAVDVDMTLLYEAAALVYRGPWVAERFVVAGDLMARDPGALLPVTRSIIDGAKQYSAADLWRSLYRVEELKHATAGLWDRIDALVVPTTPNFPTLAEIAADPLGPNGRLGTYTNFVNMLDLAALAVPAAFRPDDLPFGITLVGPRGSEARLAELGARMHARAGVRLGATDSSPAA